MEHALSLQAYVNHEFHSLILKLIIHSVIKIYQLLDTFSSNRNQLLSSAFPFKWICWLSAPGIMTPPRLTAVEVSETVGGKLLLVSK